MGYWGANLRLVSVLGSDLVLDPVWVWVRIWGVAVWVWGVVVRAWGSIRFLGSDLGLDSVWVFEFGFGFQVRFGFGCGFETRLDVGLGLDLGSEERLVWHSILGSD